MVNATSGFVNNVSSLHNYNYNIGRKASSDNNTREINWPDAKKSYKNDEAMQYVAQIQTNARNMMDAAKNLSNTATFSKMLEAYDSAAGAVRDGGNRAELREPEPARTEAEPARAASDIGATQTKNTFGRINDETAGRFARTEVPEQTATRSGTGAAQAVNERVAERTAARAARTENVAGAVRNMAESYNRMLDTAQAGRGNNRLSSDLKNAVSDYSRSLERIGITANENGSLSIDEGRFAAAGRSGALEATFSAGGANSGFTNRITGIAENVRGIRSASEQEVRNDEDTGRDREADNVVEIYRRSANDYSYAYGYSAPGTLFNLYA